MPVDVDIAARLDAIAVATLAIARAEGASAATIRAVAARLGGSTTLITKYLPNRAALLANASRYVQDHWIDELKATLGDHTGIDQLRALATWSLDTDEYDLPVRRLWLEALATDRRQTDGSDLPLRQARLELDWIETVVAHVCGQGQNWLADTLFLAFRGYYLSTIEDPDRWPPQRAAGAIHHLLDLVEALGCDRPRKPVDAASAARGSSAVVSRR